MKQSDIPKLQKMTDEQLREEVPNWDWFKNLKVGDDAIIMLDGVYYFRNDITDDGLTLAKVTAVHKDGSVEVDKGNLGRFYFCRVPIEHWGIVGLIPPKKEYLEEIHSEEFITFLKQMTTTQWKELGYDKLTQIIKIVKGNR